MRGGGIYKSMNSRRWVLLGCMLEVDCYSGFIIFIRKGRIEVLASLRMGSIWDIVSI